MWFYNLKPIYFAVIVFGLIVNSLASADYPYYDTRWPVEHLNNARHQVINEGGLFLPRGRNAKRSISLISSKALETPGFVLTRDKDQLYVIGGKFSTIAHGWIAKVNPLTLRVQKKVIFDKGGGPTFAGGCLMHANEYLYVIVGDVIYKLDPNLNILKWRVLIVNDGYNGVLAFRDGNLVMKGGGAMNQQSPSILTVLDTDLEPLIEHVVLSETNPSRIAVHVRNNREYVYITGLSKITRYEYISGPEPQLVLDTGWFYQYRNPTSDLTSYATSPTFVGNNLFTMDNGALLTEPIEKTPIQIIRVNLDNSNDAELFAPFKLPAGASFSKMIVDPQNRLLFPMDTVNRKIGAFRYLEEQKRFEELWVRSYGVSGMFAGSSAAGEIYINSFEDGHDYFVALDMNTGEELAKVRTESQMGTFAGFAVGYHNDVFMCSNLDSVLSRFTSLSLKTSAAPPLHMKLAAFEGQPLKGKIHLDWETVGEQDTLGFNVYRGDSSQGPFQQLNNALIPAQEPQGGKYEWVDDSVSPSADSYYYYIENISPSGITETSHTIQVFFKILASVKPTKSELFQNFPNSFNPETWIPYQLHQDASVTVSIYDLTGHLIRRFQLGHQPAGYYLDKSKAIHWDGTNQSGEPVASGSYWYVLQAGDFTERKRMLLIK